MVVVSLVGSPSPSFKTAFVTYKENKMEEEKEDRAKRPITTNPLDELQEAKKLK